MTLTRRRQRCDITQLPESRHQVDKCGHAHAVLLRQVSFKVVAQREQVVSQVHAVVVLDGCQVRELEQILPGQRRTASLTMKIVTKGRVGCVCVHSDLIRAAIRSSSLLVVCWDDIIEELEHVPHSEEKLHRAEENRERDRERETDVVMLSVTN